ncbi:uncharacterized protein LOC117331118 [Pecten maximus]|uniref:uncharacterized protein LOC117331118 n=1 Tax=Pecten maximus TaxID=6579 RepID=UPI001458E5C0|nr:uncharacterized protein LOC117331118 [Pecten maximus]
MSVGSHPHNGDSAVGRMFSTHFLSIFVNHDIISENKGPVPVLIISYMRSGSTFTSDVIASHPSSYYIFEPLIHSIPKTQNVGRKIELINGTIITSDDEAVLVSNFLFSWLTCQYDGLDKKSVLSLTHTNTTTPFKMCLKKGKSNNNETILQTCLKVLQKKCESSQIRLVKTIRTRMRTSVEILLKRIPGLKVLHLFRDQRPRLLSAEKTPMMTYLKLQKTAKLECSRVSDDIAMHQMLKKQHPGRLKTLLYERLAENPLWVAKRIFDFLLLPLTYSKYHIVITRG